MNRHFQVALCGYPTEEEKAWQAEGNSLYSSANDESHTFDHVLTGSEELYERAVSPLIASALNGHDAFIVAYGQPCTGKTHAVFGPPRQATTKQHGGIMSRIGQQVFDTVSKDLVCKVSATFTHVLEDGRVMDLYDSRRRPLDVVEDGSTTTFSVPGLTEHPVCSSADLTRLTEKANLIRNASGCKRDKSATTLSSPQQYWYKPHCSHAIISVVVERLMEGDKEQEGREGERFVRSQITVVDLAGHSIELVQAGQPCQDNGINILHQILTTLPSCGIVTATSLFQQSPLTKLLKPCLGGNSTTLLIGTLSLNKASIEASRRCLQVHMPHMRTLITIVSLFPGFAESCPD